MWSLPDGLPNCNFPRAQITKGQGYGTEIMKLAIRMCFADQEVGAVLIDFLAANVSAHRFYERLGFVYVARRHFGDGDCVVYKLTREAAAPTLAPDARKTA